jgi:UDP-GlcNAc:undecaprenyl-phosphate GlcNAc-1-phosphate transferase
MSLLILFSLCLLISAMTIRVGISWAPLVGIMDVPGGHKQHDTSTPFIGGIGVMAALISAIFLVRIYFPDTLSASKSAILLLNAGTIFLVGLADDKWQLNLRIRFLFQALVALSMISLDGVMLSNLGRLFPGFLIELGPLAIPFTVFATIGVINALNMLDGIDGMSGLVSMGSLLLISLVALMAGSHADFTLVIALAIALAGGVAGFLYYNLRYPSNKRARVFLGDNGSMLLGFLFARLFIDLSQGPHPAITPVTALWLFSLPLLDAAAVVLRRIWMKRSPFRPDRNHLHHLFMRSGFRVSDTVLILASIHFLFGLVGIAGLWFGVPESLMFAGFLLTFAFYIYVVVRPWRFVPAMRRIHARLGLTSVQMRGIHIGYVRRADTCKLTDTLEVGLGDRYEYYLSLHEVDSETRDESSVYAILVTSFENDDASLGVTRRVMDKLKAELAYRPGLHMRQFVQRNIENERRTRNSPIDAEDSRKSHRRGAVNKTLLQTLKAPTRGSTSF